MSPKLYEQLINREAAQHSTRKPQHGAPSHQVVPHYYPGSGKNSMHCFQGYKMVFLLGNSCAIKCRRNMGPINSIPKYLVKNNENMSKVFVCNYSQQSTTCKNERSEGVAVRIYNRMLMSDLSAAVDSEKACAKDLTSVKY